MQEFVKILATSFACAYPHSRSLKLQAMALQIHEVLVNDKRYVGPVLSLEEAVERIKSLSVTATSSYFPVNVPFHTLDDEQVHNVRATLINGYTFIYELNDLQHEESILVVYDWLRGVLPATQFRSTGAARFDHAAPDGGFFPNDQSAAGTPGAPANTQLTDKGYTYPNLIFEVGWSESVHDLHRDAKRWLAADPYVLIVIAVKIFKSRIVDGAHKRACLVSFGTDFLHDSVRVFLAGKAGRAHLPWPAVQGFAAPGQQPIVANTHNITLPRAALYSGSTLPQPAADMVLDVFDLRPIVTNLVDAACIQFPFILYLRKCLDLLLENVSCNLVSIWRKHRIDFLLF